MEQVATQVIATRGPYKDSIYEEFILWVAMPTFERMSLGMVEQKHFSEKYKVDGATLWRWKSRPDFRVRVKELRQRWATEKTSDVVGSIYKTAIKGNPLSQKLWLQYFEDFTEKSQQEQVQKVEIGVNDIRFIIDQLPEPLKTKHYANLRELLDDASAVANARAVEDSASADGLADALPEQANQSAQDVSDAQADEVAEGDTGSVREDMVREV